MKLIIQIPCYNEEETLLSVLEELPTKIKWISKIETQIIDDGSSDKTIKVASDFWVDYILKHKINSWLGNAFRTWVDNALKNWADILVNTDWDNQYPWKYISDLVQPIIKEKADIVMWNRQTSKISHFSIIKKFFQWFWSFMVRFLSWTNVPDSVSWFRAYSRESLLKLNVTSDFSYAVDTLIQAWNKNLKIEDVLITTNKPTRPSRLFKNIFDHMNKTAQILMRVYAMYNPLRIFFSIWTIFFILGSIWIWRFMYYYLTVDWDTGKIQSLTISWVLLIIAIQFYAMWIIWDLIAKNRKLIEDDLYLSKRRYYDK
jgi:glycosyltransferase involved in cell wall biosynthesis